MSPAKFLSVKKWPQVPLLCLQSLKCASQTPQQRGGNMTDRSSKLSQISKSSSLKNDSIKRHCQISCTFFFFFFPLGIPLQTGKNYVCSHLTSRPDVGSQGQPVRQGYCFLSTAIRPNRTANQTLHSLYNLRAAQVWLKERFTMTRLLEVVQDSARSSQMQVDPGLLKQTLTQHVVSIAVGQISDSVTWKKSTEPCTFFFHCLSE